MHRVEQLPLVLVQPFDLHIKNGLRIDQYSAFVKHFFGKMPFVFRLDLSQTAEHFPIPCKVPQAGKHFRMLSKIFSDTFFD